MISPVIDGGTVGTNVVGAALGETVGLSVGADVMNASQTTINISGDTKFQFKNPKNTYSLLHNYNQVHQTYCKSRPLRWQDFETHCLCLL